MVISCSVNRYACRRCNRDKTVTIPIYHKPPPIIMPPPLQWYRMVHFVYIKPGGVPDKLCVFPADEH